MLVSFTSKNSPSELSDVGRKLTGYLSLIHANSITSFLSTKGVEIPQYIIREIFCFQKRAIYQELKHRKFFLTEFLPKTFWMWTPPIIPSSPTASHGEAIGWILLTSVLYALFHYNAHSLCFLSHGSINSLLDCVISNNGRKILNSFFLFLRVQFSLMHVLPLSSRFAVSRY